MGMHAKSYLTLTVTLLAVAGLAICQESSRQIDEILSAETKWIDAIRSGDSVKLQDLLADELVYTHSIGTVVTKREPIRDLKPDVQKIEYSDQKIQVFGAVAVLTAQARITGVSKGGSYDNRVRLTHVWAKTGGIWQLVAHQATFIR
jgi:ketosteroid isomerase-like protein